MSGEYYIYNPKNEKFLAFEGFAHTFGSAEASGVYVVWKPLPSHTHFNSPHHLYDVIHNEVLVEHTGVDNQDELAYDIDEIDAWVVVARIGEELDWANSCTVAEFTR